MTQSAGRLVLLCLLIPPMLMALFAPMFVGVSYPWSFLLGVVTVVVSLAPLAWQHRHRKFDPFSPLAWSTWFFFVPAFGVGGILVALGFTPAWLMQHIPNPASSFALTQFYLALGVVSLGAGYLAPAAERAGRRLSARLPQWSWAPRDALVPGLLLLAAGVGLTLLAFRMGLIGYQGAITGANMGVAVYFFSLSWMLADVLLWGLVFRSGLSARARFAIAALLVALIPLHIFLTASRATPLNHLLALALAYNYSGRRVAPRHLVIFGVLACVALGSGVLYGTAFRDQKTIEAIAAGVNEAPRQPPVVGPSVEPVSSDAPPMTVVVPAPSALVPPLLSPGEAKATLREQQEVALRAGGAIAERGVTGNVGFVLAELGDRLEHVGSVAAIVANYTRLRPEEDRRGLSGNIWRWTWSGFVPRVFWPDKPPVGDPRPFAELYIGFGGSSPPPTPVSDLLRNFGPLGIPIGMFILGLAMRTMHSALIGNGSDIPLGRTVLYYSLLVRLNMEGFYGTILPDVMRAGFAAGLACVAITVAARLMRRRAAAPA